MADEGLSEAFEAKAYGVITDQSYRDRHKVTAKARQLVIDRDDGRCVLCREPGEEIDHIAYAEDVKAYNAPENLRYLCRKCHGEKVYGDEGPAYARIDVTWTPKQIARYRDVMHRANAPEPLRRCDDHLYWTPSPNCRNIMPELRRQFEAEGLTQKQIARFMTSAKAAANKRKVGKSRTHG